MVCYLSTHSPDGGNVGLHKHLSTSVNITSGVCKTIHSLLKKIKHDFHRRMFIKYISKLYAYF